MPTTTARGAFPSPISSDPDNVPSDISTLANRIASVGALYASGTEAARTSTVTGTAWANAFYFATDTNVLWWYSGSAWTQYSPTTNFSTSLPTSPTPGEEVYLQAQESTVAVWHMKWDGLSWRFLGGNPITYETRNVGMGTAWSNFMNGGLPFTGTYNFRIDITFRSNTAGYENIYYYGLSSTNTISGPGEKAFAIVAPSSFNQGTMVSSTLYYAGFWTAQANFYTMARYYATGGYAPTVENAVIQITPRYLNR